LELGRNIRLAIEDKKMKLRLVTWSLTVVLLTFSANSHGHHSAGAYDNSKRISLTGKVVEWQFRNPHAVLIIEVQTEGGRTERWEVETGAAVNLRRSRGWDENTFRPGDSITVSGNPHRNPNAKQIAGGEFNDQTRRIPTQRRDAPAAVQIMPHHLGLTGISGRWRPPFRGPGSMPRPASGSPLPLTPAGLRAWNEYRAERSPATTCEPMGIPTLFYVGYVVDIGLARNEVVMHYELYDVIRRIPIGGRPRMASATPLLGESVARIDGKSLIIETSKFTPSAWGLAVAAIPLGNDKDVPSSAQKKITERYTVSDDGKTLVLDYTVEDPVYLSRPFSDRVSIERLPDNAEMYEFKCDPKAAARFTGGASSRD
jgi:hypothetical protein